VVRPDRAPCGARAALSWDHGALRGDDPLAATDMGSVGPLGVLTPSGLPRDGRAERIAPRGALRAPSDSLQRSVAAPPHRPGLPKESSSDDASSPGLSCPTTHARTTVRLPGASSPGASRARFGYLLRDRDRRTCGKAFRPLRASSGFSLQGFLLAPVGLPLGSPCPPAVARVLSPRPLRSVRTRSASGPRSRRRARSAVALLRARRVDAFLGFVPPERSPPPSLRALICSRPLPHHALGGTDVPNRLRLEVFRNGRVGWPLSGLPALLGFSTLRPSRRRGSRAEGGLMDSPHGSRRVRAANRSEPSRVRPEPGGEPRPDAAVHR